MIDSEIAPKWYCVRSTAGYESRTAMLLERVASEFRSAVGEVRAFCPAIRKAIPVGGIRRTVSRAMFPSYFFARFCLGTAARFVASRPGIVGLVRFGGFPATVPDEVVEEMRGMDRAAASVSVLSQCHFIAGQKLLIREGPFAGLEAEYIATLREGQRALLLLEYLQQRVKVVADCTVLESEA